MPRFEDKKGKGRRRKGKEREGGRKKKSSDSCKNEPLAILPRRAKKKEFATSCRHRFPVSLRPRRGSAIEFRGRKRTCEGLRPRAGPSAKRRSATMKRRFSLNGEGFSRPPCIGTSCDIYIYIYIRRSDVPYAHRLSDKIRSMRSSTHECTTVAFGFSLTPGLSRGRTRFSTVQQRGVYCIVQHRLSRREARFSSLASLFLPACYSVAVAESRRVERVNDESGATPK